MQALIYVTQIAVFFSFFKQADWVYVNGKK